MRALGFTAITVALVVALGASASAALCPFCSAVSQTFTEEMAGMDVVVFAELAKQAEPPVEGEDDPSQVTRATFRIVTVLKGSDFVSTGESIETIYFGDAKPGDRFLVQGVRPPDIAWSTPMRVSARGLEYLAKLDSVPAQGADRLKFFVAYLEDEDEMLARDAYDEFAKAPYQDVIDLKESMDRERLLGWIADPDVSASRKRLYFTMLGICGSEGDLPLLERLMRSTDRRDKAGLDALIACYLTLTGEQGLTLIEELFLAPPEADYSDTYAAITALRFHGTDGNKIDKRRIVRSLELMLDRPALADLVIPDLARWEDWEVMDRLVQLFRDADEKTSWVRVPVINYLRACPLPEAKQHLEALKEIDPDAVRRANTFFPVLDESDLEEEGEDDGNEPESNDDGGSGTTNEPEAGGGGNSPIAKGNVKLSKQSSQRPASGNLALTSLASAVESAEAAEPSPASSESSNETEAAALAPRANPPSVRVVGSLGAWSDSSRTVATRPTASASAPNRNRPEVLVGAVGRFPRLGLVLGGMTLTLLLFGAVQWSVLTGRMARFVN